LQKVADLKLPFLFPIRYKKSPDIFLSDSIFSEIFLTFFIIIGYSDYHLVSQQEFFFSCHFIRSGFLFF